MHFITLFDDQEYRRSLLEALKSLKQETSSDAILYILKSRIALNNFELFHQKDIKHLVFYYFFLLREVRFSNQYSIFIYSDKILGCNFSYLARGRYAGLKDFVQYFDLGKNYIFLNKICDTTLSDISDSLNEDAYKVDNIIDFFIVFLVENFELYSLESEHFPLFKWLINEFHDIYS